MLEEGVDRILRFLRPDSPFAVDAIRREVQHRMSDCAGILCNAEAVRNAFAGARALNQSIRRDGIAFDGAYEAARALQWRQTALLSEAVLTALAFYVERGGGSRGARAVCAPHGDRTPEARSGPLAEVRFVSERLEDRAEQIVVRAQGEGFACGIRPIRRRDRDERPFFERDWPDFLTGAIHHSPLAGRR